MACQGIRSHPQGSASALRPADDTQFTLEHVVVYFLAPIAPTTQTPRMGVTSNWMISTPGRAKASTPIMVGAKVSLVHVNKNGLRVCALVELFAHFSCSLFSIVFPTAHIRSFNCEFWPRKEQKGRD